MITDDPVEFAVKDIPKSILLKVKVDEYAGQANQITPYDYIHNPDFGEYKNVVVKEV